MVPTNNFCDNTILISFLLNLFNNQIVGMYYKKSMNFCVENNKTLINKCILFSPTLCPMEGPE